jgi:hypothetical protein
MARLHYDSKMSFVFDCSVDLTIHHPMPPGLAAGEVVRLVRETIETLPGANWISVEWFGDVSPSLPWLRLYAPGDGGERTGAAWDALADHVRKTVHRALVGAFG